MEYSLASNQWPRWVGLAYENVWWKSDYTVPLLLKNVHDNRQGMDNKKNSGKAFKGTVSRDCLPSISYLQRYLWL